MLADPTSMHRQADITDALEYMLIGCVHDGEWIIPARMPMWRYRQFLHMVKKAKDASD